MFKHQLLIRAIQFQMLSNLWLPHTDHQVIVMVLPMVAMEGIVHTVMGVQGMVLQAMGAMGTMVLLQQGLQEEQSAL